MWWHDCTGDDDDNNDNRKDNGRSAHGAVAE